MTAPDGKIRIPLNEEARAAGQIEEYLMQFNGEGIQHIALLCDDLITATGQPEAAGVPLMTAPSATYYDMLEGRLPNHGEDVAALQSRGILLDGTTEGRQAAPVAADFLGRRSSARCSSNSSSARATTVLVKATSRRCLNRWSATR
jgi:4-hydroxyphenylpyruvate dioxygenase-like putative hemolysin